MSARPATYFGIVCFVSALMSTNVFGQALPACNTATTPFCSSSILPPTGWGGKIFKLSQNYPTALPNDKQPWLAFDPIQQPEQYLRAALDYFYEGNIRPNVEESFDPSLNSIRNWYNAPWQDFGINGREPLHGLTRERTSRPHELDAAQDGTWSNYAIGFYNAPGGLAIGRMWANRAQPNPALATMPNGTVAAKLLFTTAPVSQVPYLQGAPAWNVYVFADPSDAAPTPSTPRTVMPVRLLQIDIAVKDRRVRNLTGWIFGTFVYGGGPGRAGSGTGWSNVHAVGSMWGNDPAYSGTGPLKETWINPQVQMPHLGFQGRLNGPVDNPRSSCLSCHSTAEAPAGNMTPPTGVNPAPWFRNIPSGTPFDTGRQAMDYSLQLSVGLTNFLAARQLARSPNALSFQNLSNQFMQISRQPPRDGGPIH